MSSDLKPCPVIGCGSEPITLGRTAVECGRCGFVTTYALWNSLPRATTLRSLSDEVSGQLQKWAEDGYPSKAVMQSWFLRWVKVLRKECVPVKKEYTDQEKAAILRGVAASLEKQEELPPEYAKAVNDHFWEML